MMLRPPVGNFSLAWLMAQFVSQVQFDTIVILLAHINDNRVYEIYLPSYT